MWDRRGGEVGGEGTSPEKKKFPTFVVLLPWKGCGESLEGEREGE